MRSPSAALFRWFSHGDRLVGLVVATSAVAVLALGYGFLNDRSQGASERRADEAANEAQSRFYSCIARYVSEASKVNAPRTQASIAASNARYNYDRGFDDKHPTWDVARLRAEYLRLYAAYKVVAATNPPLPAFSQQFCDGQANG